MRLSTTTISKFPLEINASSKLQRSIWLEINVKSLEVCWRVDDTNITSLNKVVGDDEMFLIWCDLEVVWTDLKTNRLVRALREASERKKVGLTVG